MIVVHIGMPKAGSTSIQTFFAAHADALRRVSLDYSNVGRFDCAYIGHHNFANQLKGETKFRRARGTLQDLEEHLRAGEYEKTLLSAERLAECDSEQISTFHATLTSSGQGATILLVIRDILSFLVSLYGQRIRFGGNTADFDAFFERWMADKRRGFHATARRWASVFGWANMRVRILDPALLVNGDLIDDVLCVTGLDPAEPAVRALQRPGRINEATGWRILEARRALYAGRHGLPANHPLATAVGAADRRTDQLAIEAATVAAGEDLGWAAERGLYMTGAQAERALAVYGASISRLNEKLAERLPLPPGLEARQFRAREFLPDATQIPPADLRAFYDDAGARLGAADGRERP